MKGVGVAIQGQHMGWAGGAAALGAVGILGDCARMGDLEGGICTRRVDFC